jgi:hypothetical protein
MPNINSAYYFFCLGFRSVVTYNDTILNDEDEAWSNVLSDNTIVASLKDSSEDRLREVVFAVLEGFTIDHTVRKMLEKAYYGN